MSEPKAIDLFAGAGGASLGIEQAGFNLVASIDKNEPALKTHEHNLDAKTIQHDLTEVDLDILPTRDIDYMHGSPPCKGFSDANKSRSLDDPRNNLVHHFIDWIEELEPQVVTMENVTGMLNISNEFMDGVVGRLKRLGYKTKYKVLNAADYGVPQERERVITIASKENNLNKLFPQPTHSKTATTTLTGEHLDGWVSVNDVIGENIWFDEGYLTSNVAEAHQRGGRRPLWSIHRPSQTVLASGLPKLLPDNGVGGDWDNARELTIDEFKKIQSFPDWFEFKGTKGDKVLQIGNAVPPKLQYHIAKTIYKNLN